VQISRSLLWFEIVNAVVQGMTAAAEMQAVSGRTVSRGPAVRPGGGEAEQVPLYILCRSLSQSV